MNRIVCIGEMLIDFFTVETDVSLSEAEQFVRKAGGAPANVCAAVARLGGHVSFCGKVGKDAFGRFLEKTLETYEIDTRYLMKSDIPTTLAFVTRQQNGERDFAFQRGADGDVSFNDLKGFAFDEEVAHFGSATALLESPFCDAYMELMGELRKKGAFISFDPNYRADLWGDRLEDYLKAVQYCVSLADFVKMSEQEYEVFIDYLSMQQLSPVDVTKAVVAVTLGAEGTKLITGDHERIIPSVQVDCVDTTGAGDAFVGGMLYQLAADEGAEVRKRLVKKRQEEHCDQNLVESLVAMVEFANVVGALTCTQVGAMEALPTRETVLLRQRK